VENEVLDGDCLEVLRTIPANSVNLVYLDPPFFTGRKHSSSSRDGSKRYSFDDIWQHSSEYFEFLVERLLLCRRSMKADASIFFHCDHNSTHIARQALDLVFGSENFQSEIIWAYKRWSNAKRGLLQQHQNILFYGNGPDFKWNPAFVDYSATTNVDQILQKRTRDDRGKSVYATGEDGSIVFDGNKKGVPLGDVWNIPFLNPKARERTGYPTQKPLLLLERIVALASDEGDLVLDPFCGSGTTLVAAKLLNRRFLGIDVSNDATTLAKARLEAPVRTDSALLRKGVEAYLNNDPWVEAHLAGLAVTRIQRNTGADGLLKDGLGGKAAFVRVQRQGESVAEAASALKKTVRSKGDAVGVLIATESDLFGYTDSDIHILRSPALQLSELVNLPDADDISDIPMSRTA
jgi:site-specific DNA-methyltransferase (adenine-specific)